MVMIQVVEHESMSENGFRDRLPMATSPRVEVMYVLCHSLKFTSLDHLLFVALRSGPAAHRRINLESVAVRSVIPPKSALFRDRIHPKRLSVPFLFLIPECLIDTAFLHGFLRITAS
jgi:hypothetical protein